MLNCQACAAQGIVLLATPHLLSNGNFGLKACGARQLAAENQGPLPGLTHTGKCRTGIEFSGGQIAIAYPVLIKRVPQAVAALVYPQLATARRKTTRVFQTGATFESK
jgi:hypothetical protein